MLGSSLMRKHFPIWLLVLCLLAACDQQTTVCLQTEAVRCRVVFSCDSLVQTADTAYIGTFTVVDSLTVQGLGSDSVLYANSKAVSSISLPLRKDTVATAFCLRLNDATDTLTIRHTNNEYYVSLACGCFVFHQVDTALSRTGLVQKVEVLNTAVENVEQDNLRLYVHFR